jgi:CRP-like cAMP-binding protein
MSILTKSTVFSEISGPTLRQIEAIAEPASYSAGTFIFREGDTAQYFYTLENGRVRLRMGQDGQVAYVLSTPGEIFGWASMVDHDDYNLSAQCVVAVRAIRFEGRKLLQILQTDPASGLIFFRRLTEVIGHRLMNSYRATVAVHGEKASLSYG